MRGPSAQIAPRQSSKLRVDERDQLLQGLTISLGPLVEPLRHVTRRSVSRGAIASGLGIRAGDRCELPANQVCAR